MHTEKKFLIPAALAAALCIGIAGIGRTLAVLTDQDELTNCFAFVGEDGLDGVLTEPSWKPEEGLLVLPGETILKDPQVTNTSGIDMNALTALQVEFVYGAGCPDQEKSGQALSEEDMAYVCDVYRIDWNADLLGDWVRFDGETAGDQTQRFYYKNVLERNYPDDGDTTIPLFTNLAIPKDVNNARYSHIQDMGGFDIRISGTIVQQMAGETGYGINSPESAYQAGLFTFTTNKK